MKFDCNFANRNEYVGMKWDGVAIPWVSLHSGHNVDMLEMKEEVFYVLTYLKMGGKGGHFIPTYWFLFAKLQSNFTR